MAEIGSEEYHNNQMNLMRSGAPDSEQKMYESEELYYDYDAYGRLQMCYRIVIKTRIVPRWRR